MEVGLLLYKFQYQNEEDRTNILANNTDKILIEEHNLFEGNFLIFTDTPRIEEQIIALKNDNLILMSALAQIYEDMLAKGTV